MKYDDHDWVMKQLTAAQEADRDNRARAREAHEFCDKRDGQWEAHRYEAADNKPRYTFDKVNPIINQICNELYDVDFGIVVDPAGGQATSKDAQTYEGIVRHIENISEAAAKVYHPAARNSITAGIDGWRLVQKYVDDDSFDQDITFEPLNNFVDRVWFDPNAEERDCSDAKYCYVMQALSEEEYKRRWPEGSGEGVKIEKENNAYWSKKDFIMVGEFYCVKEKNRELVLFSNGDVYPDDDQLQMVTDELAAMGITEVRRRTRKEHVVYTRKFDNRGWLEDEQETVFDRIPVVPVYANFKVYENKVIYWGAVEKLIDPQRVLNYSLSREIEEGALAPRSKYWMTEVQAEGYMDTLESLNTNADPVQFYNPDPEAPGAPQQIGGAQINPGLRVISDSMSQLINETAGMFSANMGQNAEFAQSGVAVRRLQDKGDTGSYGYTIAMQVALAQTFRILTGAIPKVYQEERQVRIMNEDGTSEVITLNQPVQDQQTGQLVYLNDLRTGKYNVTCRAGSAFRNRQEQTIDAIERIAQLDPSIITMGKDVMLQNIPSPGMDLLAERARMELFNAGMIPYEQLTDEEKQILEQQQQQAANEEAPADPMMVAAQAEMVKAQDQQAQGEHDRQMDMMNIQLKQQENQQKNQLESAKLSYQLQNNQQAQQANQQRFQLEMNKQMIDAINAQAKALKDLKDAMGADMIQSPDAARAYQGIAQNMADQVGKPEFEYDLFNGVLQ